MSIVFVRALDPDESLNVDHVARPEITNIATNSFCKSQKTVVGIPIWAGLVLEVKAIDLSCAFRHHRFQEHIHFRLRDESEYGDDGPCENSSLFSRETGNYVDPFIESRLEISFAVEEVVETFDERL